MDIHGWMTSLFSQEILISAVRIVLLVGIGIPAIKLINKLVDRGLAKYGTPHLRHLISRAISYIGITFIFISVLHELGFQIGALLGAAGIAGAAIGFASQTSVSNIISGLFVLSESPFKVGDSIEVQGVIGTVESIDLLSIKLRQYNGTYVRIAHEQIIKSNLVNLSYFDERRVEFNLLVSQKEDVRRVIELIKSVIDDSQYAYKEKEPLILCNEFNESTLNIFVGAWSRKPHYLDLKKSILVEMKERFDRENILIPFPHMAVALEK